MLQITMLCKGLEMGFHHVLQVIKPQEWTPLPVQGCFWNPLKLLGPRSSEKMDQKQVQN